MSGPAVFKFGGTSLADGDRIRRVSQLVAGAGTCPVVVVSAPAGMTEALVHLTSGRADGEDPPARGDDREFAGARAQLRDAVRRIARDVGGDRLADRTGRLVDERLASFQASAGASAGLPPAGQARDALLGLGEDISTLLVSEALLAEGLDAVRVDARDLIRTDGGFGAAEPDVEAIRTAAQTRLLPLAAEGRIPVVQGFIGATSDGRTTTLGRGGSDLTATLLGAAIESSAVHIWTDVDGILTGDPRWVARPLSLDVVGFEEAVELAWFGAKVLHAGAAKHAVAHRLPVRIRSTFAPERPGTLVLADRWGGPDIAAVACKRAVALIQVRSRPSAIEYGFLAEVFGTLAAHRTPVDLVATSHTSTAFTIDEGAEIGALANALDRVAEVDVRSGLATVTVVGRGLLREPGFAARVFQTVAFTPVHMISQATDSSLSFLVDDEEAEALVRRLHLVLIEGRAGRGADGPRARGAV
jgi:aspartate kinase